MPDSPAEFSLPATGGGIFNPAAHRGQPLVLYFYPKDNTPGCTTEAQDFRARHGEFTQLGCAIVGISRDSIKSHENFKARLELPFELAADPDEVACEAFGVMKTKKLYGKSFRGIERSTFVIGRDGRIVREWRGVKVPGHVDEVLDTVRGL